MREDIKSLLHQADHVLIAFDGPLCTVFDPSEARATAEGMGLLLGANLPHKIAITCWKTSCPYEAEAVAGTA